MNEKNPRSPGNENEPNQQEHPSHEAGQQPSSAIYVASLADYNNGVLHGAWIDAAREPAEIQADPELFEAFAKLNKVNRYAFTHRLHHAKRPETKAKLLQRLREGRPIYE